MRTFSFTKIFNIFIAPNPNKKNQLPGTIPSRHPETRTPLMQNGIEKMLIKHPGSEKQREAARRNGSKSKGPVTPQGKLNSSHKGIAEGLLVRTVVLEFAALLASLSLELNPQTDIEHSLVENLAICRWRQRRMQGMEKAAVTAEVAKQDGLEGPAGKTTQAYRNLAESSTWLDRMNVWEARAAREYSRTLKAHRTPRAAPDSEKTPVQPCSAAIRCAFGRKDLRKYQIARQNPTDD